MANDTKTHDDLVADWKGNAEKHDEKNYWFLRSLKQRSPKKVDRIALELHQEAFSIVDCTKCAHCCRTLRVVVTDDDIPRIAAHLGMAPDEFIATYLERDEEEGGLARPRWGWVTITTRICWRRWHRAAMATTTTSRVPSSYPTSFRPN